MKLKIYSNNEIKDIDIFNYDIIDILDTLETDLEIKHINKVKLTITLVKGRSSKIKQLESNIDRMESCTSSKMCIKDIKQLYFDVEIEGKLGDVFGTITALNIQNEFTRIDIYTKNDLGLIRELTSNGQFRIDINRSLILRYMSEKNSNMNINTVFDILRKDIKRVELRKMLPDIFEEIYGYPPEKAIFTSTKDKLNLNSIDDKLVVTIDDELRERLGVRRRRT